MSSPMRTRRAATTTTRRFGRRTPPQRRGIAGGWLQRSRPEPQSRFKRMFRDASRSVPGRSAARSTATSKRGRRSAAGGLALMAGAAGLVFGMIRRRNATRTGAQ
jgi:ferric-dicitrate binding protein FerR (iron transport regulator)